MKELWAMKNIKVYDTKAIIELNLKEFGVFF